MTDKIILSNVATFDNTIINVINENNSTLVAAIDNTLSRNGTSPNQMGDALDMNSYPILNLPAPGSPNSPARLIDVTSTNPISISLSLTGDVNASASSGTLVTTVNKIKGVGLGTTTATSGNLLVADGTNWQSVPTTGVVAIDHTGLTTFGTGAVQTGNIAAGAVTLAEMANLAANSVVGNNTGSTATPIALTKTQLTAMNNTFTTSLAGTVPASGGGTTNFMRADGSWAVPPSAQTWQLLNTLTASSSANLTDLTSLTSSYNTYEIILTNLISGSNNILFQLQLHAGGSYKTTGYQTNWVGWDGTNTTVVNNSITTYIPLTYPGVADLSSTTPGVSGKIRIYAPSVASTVIVSGEVFYVPNTSVGLRPGMFMGYWNTSAVVDGFKLLMSSGNITSGTVKVYGLV